MPFWFSSNKMSSEQPQTVTPSDVSTRQAGADLPPLPPVEPSAKSVAKPQAGESSDEEGELIFLEVNDCGFGEATEEFPVGDREVELIREYFGYRYLQDELKDANPNEIKSDGKLETVSFYQRRWEDMDLEIDDRKKLAFEKKQRMDLEQKERRKRKEEQRERNDKDFDPTRAANASSSRHQEKPAARSVLPSEKPKDKPKDQSRGKSKDKPDKKGQKRKHDPIFDSEADDDELTVPAFSRKSPEKKPKVSKSGPDFIAPSASASISKPERVKKSKKVAPPQRAPRDVGDTDVEVSGPESDEDQILGDDVDVERGDLNLLRNPSFKLKNADPRHPRKTTQDLFPLRTHCLKCLKYLVYEPLRKCAYGDSINCNYCNDGKGTCEKVSSHS